MVFPRSKFIAEAAETGTLVNCQHSSVEALARVEIDVIFSGTKDCKDDVRKTSIVVSMKQYVLCRWRCILSIIWFYVGRVAWNVAL